LQIDTNSTCRDDLFVLFVVAIPVIAPREASPFVLGRMRMKTLSDLVIDCRENHSLILDEKRLKQNDELAEKESYKGLSLCVWLFIGVTQNL
jgi:hypothetical protein